MTDDKWAKLPDKDYSRLAPQFRPGGGKDPMWMGPTRGFIANGVKSVDPEIVADLFRYYDALALALAAPPDPPGLSEPTEAMQNLREHQTQLDQDGCFVGVSRQALTEVLDHYAALIAYRGKG